MERGGGVEEETERADNPDLVDRPPIIPRYLGS